MIVVDSYPFNSLKYGQRKNMTLNMRSRSPTPTGVLHSPNEGCHQIWIQRVKQFLRYPTNTCLKYKVSLWPWKWGAGHKKVTGTPSMKVVTTYEHRRFKVLQILHWHKFKMRSKCQCDLENEVKVTNIDLGWTFPRWSLKPNINTPGRTVLEMSQ